MTSSHATTTTTQQEKQQLSPFISSSFINYEENSPLNIAVSEGNEDEVRRLLDNNNNDTDNHSNNRDNKDINSQNIYGYTPLLTALSKGYTKLAFMLIEAGSNVHISTLEGLSPLHMAAIHCDECTILKLLQNGAFLNTQDEVGDSVLHWVIRENNVNMLSLLLGGGGNVGIICVDIKNEDGETPLHLAASFGEEPLVELLVKHGACIDIKDNLGLTPTDHALENSHYKVAHVLSKMGTGGRKHHGTPYRRNCGGDMVHNNIEYEKKHKNINNITSAISTEVPPPSNFC